MPTVLRDKREVFEMAAVRPAPPAPGWHDLTTRVWIIVSAGASCVGWILSALHALNAVGYVCALMVAFLAGGVWIKQHRLPPLRLARILRRYRRPLPGLFLVLLAMALLGGSLYPPLHADALIYRIPRTLHWLQEGRWHWIHTFDQRLNNRGVGFEWLSVPLMALTHSVRGIFLINVTSFALMPGLIFRVFRQYGLARRQCWLWMWVLPAGFCYALPAGGAGNDGAYVAVYLLAAMWLAGRFRKSGHASDLYLSILSAALLTGAKASNLPLLLPWIAAFFPWPTAWRLRPAPASLVAGVALLASFLPNAYFNYTHLGDWTGLSGAFQAPGPLWGLLGNSFLIVAQNVWPPFSPVSGSWNTAVGSFLSKPWGEHFRAFEDFGVMARAVHDETASLGPGIVLFLIAAMFARSRASGPPPRSWSRTLLIYTPWVALAALMAKSGLRDIGRVLSPYYPLLIASALTFTPARRPWLSPRALRLLAVCVMLLTVFTVTVSRMRPLFPANWLLSHLQARYPQSHFVQQAVATFASSRNLGNYLDPLLAQIPPSEKRIAVFSNQAMCEAAMANPVGRFQFRLFNPTDSPAELREAGIHYVIVDAHAFPVFGKATLGDVLQMLNARLVAQVVCQIDPQPGVEAIPFYLVEVNSTSPAAAEPAGAKSR